MNAANPYTDAYCFVFPASVRGTLHNGDLERMGVSIEWRTGSVFQRRQQNTQLLLPRQCTRCVVTDHFNDTRDEHFALLDSMPDDVSHIL